jgi:hypothetical protein
MVTGTGRHRASTSARAELVLTAIGAVLGFLAGWALVDLIGAWGIAVAFLPLAGLGWAGLRRR